MAKFSAPDLLFLLCNSLPGPYLVPVLVWDRAGSLFGSCFGVVGPGWVPVWSQFGPSLVPVWSQFSPGLVPVLVPVGAGVGEKGDPCNNLPREAGWGAGGDLLMQAQCRYKQQSLHSKSEKLQQPICIFTCGGRLTHLGSLCKLC